MNIHKKTRINKQDRQKITFPDLLTPRRSPSSILPLHTQKQCTVRGSSWGLPCLSLTTEGSWIHLGGRDAKPLVSPLMPVTPFDSRRTYDYFHMDKFDEFVEDHHERGYD